MYHRVIFVNVLHSKQIKIYSLSTSGERGHFGSFLHAAGRTFTALGARIRPPGPVINKPDVFEPSGYLWTVLVLGRTIVSQLGTGKAKLELSIWRM